MEHYLFLVSISFMISTLIDVLIIGAVFFLLYKIFRTKIVAVENNREIYDHDQKIADLQEKVDEIKHG